MLEREREREITRVIERKRVSERDRKRVLSLVKIFTIWHVTVLQMPKLKFDEEKMKYGVRWFLPKFAS